MKTFDIKRTEKSQIMFDGEIVNKENIGNCCRDIYMTAEFVIKFDPRKETETHYLRVDCQCRNEYKNWNKFKKTEYAMYFVPVVQFGVIDGYAYVVMPRVEIPDMDYDTQKNKGGSIVNKIAGIFGICDMHQGNWTVIKKQVQIFDYSF